MLDEMDADQLVEWQAFYEWERKAEAEAQTRATLAAKAEQGVANHKRRRR